LLDWRLGGELTRQLQHGQLSGEFGEPVVFRSNGKIAAEWVLFLGAGAYCEFDRVRQREALACLWTVLRKAGWGKVAAAIQQSDLALDRMLLPLAEETWNELADNALTGLLSTDRSWIRR